MKRTVGILAAATFAASGLASGFMAPTGAHAQFSGCRSDPLVWLDNGVKVQLTSTVATDSSNIRDHQLHPARACRSTHHTRCLHQWAGSPARVSHAVLRCPSWNVRVGHGGDSQRGGR